jgi:hypothetical protein
VPPPTTRKKLISASTSYSERGRSLIADPSSAWRTAG